MIDVVEWIHFGCRFCLFPSVGRHEWLGWHWLLLCVCVWLGFAWFNFPIYVGIRHADTSHHIWIDNELIYRLFFLLVIQLQIRPVRYARHNIHHSNKGQWKTRNNYETTPHHRNGPNWHTDQFISMLKWRKQNAHRKNWLNLINRRRKTIRNNNNNTDPKEKSAQIGLDLALHSKLQAFSANSFLFFKCHFE